MARSKLAASGGSASSGRLSVPQKVGIDPDPRDDQGRRRPGDLAGAPDRAARGPAGDHRADGRGPVGQHRGLGRGRLPRRDPRAARVLALPRAPALPGHESRSAMDISVALDSVGGEFNAFTAKEYTCFHARVLVDDLPLAVDVLGDMVTDSLVSAADVEAERDVILDEIAMHDDDPDDVVHNLFAAQAWGDGPLGRPIAGTAESIGRLTRAQVMRFYRRHYRPANMVVAVAGAVDHAKLVRQVRRAFSRNDFLSGDEAPGGAAGRGPRTPGAGRHRERPPTPGAGQPRARRQRPHPHRRPAVRAGRPQHGAGRGHVLAALPGGPRATRARLLGVLVRQPPRRRRAGRRVGGLPAGQARRRPGHGPGRAGQGGRRRHHPGGAGSRQGPARRAGWCWDSRTRARGCHGWARRSWSTTSC